MTSEILTPEQSPQDILSPSSSQPVNKPQRVLACVLCQQRKVRCDRKFPCANCKKVGVECVSAALAPRQRRRRFPERELLERLRHYEDLLQRNNIPFEPLHPTSNINDYTQPTFTDASARRMEERNLPSELRTGDFATAKQAKSFWHAMNQKVLHNYCA
jgi:ribosomal protein L13E